LATGKPPSTPTASRPSPELTGSFFGFTHGATDGNALFPG
jgi:hypothetical protein